MKIALIADAFPPMRSSGAVQLRDLAREMVREGHKVTVIVPAPGRGQSSRVERWEGIEVLRLASPQTKDVSYARRTLGELLMPYAMLARLRMLGRARDVWDGVIWYSPTIFLGPLASSLRRRSGCRSYLIVRDIFPEWAVDMGLMRRGLPYHFFRAVARYQYSVADVIGVQTAGNLPYFGEWAVARRGRRLEVLQNWLTRASTLACSIDVSRTPIAGRKIFVYAGNMGIAQGMSLLIELARELQSRRDIGFLFVGRGSDALRIRQDAAELGLDNVVFFDEIDPDEIAGLYAQCHVGIVALDQRHKTHNIPGKFLSYMHSGLPVLAAVNKGNDLVKLIETERVGLAEVDASASSLARAAERLLAKIKETAGYGERCRALAAKMFSSDAAARQILSALR